MEKFPTIYLNIGAQEPKESSFKKPGKAIQPEDLIPAEKIESVNKEVDSEFGTKSLMELLDNFNRFAYARNSSAIETIKRAKNKDGDYSYDSVFDDLKAVGSKALSGMSLEEKKTIRDVSKELAPEVVAWVEDNATLQSVYNYLPPGAKYIASSLLGAGFKPDVLDIPELAVDVYTDPIGKVSTLAKEGAIIGAAGIKKGVKALSEMEGAIASVGKKTIEGASKVEKMADALVDKYTEVVGPYLDRMKVFKKYGLDQEMEKNRMIIENSSAVAQNIAKSAGVVNHELETGAKAISQMTTDESNLIGKKLHEMSDIGNQTYEKFISGKIGSGVEQINQSNQVKNLVDSINEYEKSAGKFVTDKQYQKFAEHFGVELNKEVIDAVKQGKNIKRMSNHMAAQEYKVQELTIKAGLERTKQARKILMQDIDDGILQSNKMVKGDVSSVFDDIQSTNVSVSKGLKSLQDDIGDSFKNGMTEDLNSIMGQKIDLLSQRLEYLGKYDDKATKLAAKGLTEKSSTPLKSYQQRQDIMRTLLSVKDDLNKTALGLTQEAGEGIQKSIEDRIKYIDKGLKYYGKTIQNEVKILGSKTALGEDAVQEIIKEGQSRISTLMGQKKSLDKMLLMHTIKAQTQLRNAAIEKSVNSRKYYNAYTGILKPNKMKEYALEWAPIERQLEYKLIKEMIPTHLQENAKFMRRNFKEYQDKLLNEGVIKGTNPMYVPRMFSNEFYDMMGSTFNQQQKSFTKERVFKNSQDTRAWLEKKAKDTKTIEGFFANTLGWGKQQNPGMIDDSQVLLYNFVNNAENVLAKERMKKALEENFGKYEMVPDSVKKSYEGMFKINQYYNASSLEHILGKVAGGANKALKFMLTVPNAAYQINNMQGWSFLSATEASLRNSFSPGTMVSALKLKAGMGGAEKIGKYTADEVKKAMSATTHFGGQWVGTNIKYPEIAFRRMQDVSAAGLGMKNAEKNLMYGLIHADEVGRTASLVALLKDGYTMEEAMKKSRKAIWGHDMSNSAVDQFMQSHLMAFYAFPRKNLPQLVKSMVSEPQKYATFAKVLNKVTHREDLSQDEIDHLNSYEKADIQFFANRVNDLRKYYVSGSFPMSDAYRSIEFLTTLKKENLLSRLNPVVKSTIDFLTSKDSFTGQDFQNHLPANYTDAIPDWLGNTIGLKKKPMYDYQNGKIQGVKQVWVGDPDVIGFIRGFPLWSRQLNTFSKENDPENKRELIDSILSAFQIKQKTLDTSKKKPSEYKRSKLMREAAISEGARENKILSVDKRFLSPDQMTKRQRKNLKRVKKEKKER